MFFSNDSSMFQAWLLLSMMNPQSLDSCGIPNSSPMTVASPQASQGFKAFQECQVNENVESKSRKSSNMTSADMTKYQLSPKKIIKDENDDDYSPAQNSKKKARKNKQDENRNVVPNSIHQILSFIQKKNKSLVYVQRVFQKFDHQEICTINRFYLFQLRMKQNVNHYVNQTTLKLLNQLHDPNFQVFSQSQQRFYLKVCRIIVHQFLNQESASIILTSKRMCNDKKKNHLSVRRFLKEKLQDIYKN